MVQLDDATDMARLEAALAKLGQPLTEMQARELNQPEDCDCKEGMFAIAPSRRGLLRGAGLVAAAGFATVASRPVSAKGPPGSTQHSVSVDPTKELGRLTGDDGGYGARPQFEIEVRQWVRTRTASFTPMQNGHGIITPSGLHFERHHAGIPTIDPAKHRLVVHGLVDRPMSYSVEDLKRFPTASRFYFIECSGTTSPLQARQSRPYCLDKSGGGRQQGANACGGRDHNLPMPFNNVGDGFGHLGAVGTQKQVTSVLCRHLLVYRRSRLRTRFIIDDSQLNRSAKETAARVDMLLKECVAFPKVVSLKRVGVARERQ